MTDINEQARKAAQPKRADARRNEQTLLDAAAALFVTSGVEVPVRDIAAKAGVGTGTIYRHFPTRADLIIAVYRYQVEACAEATTRAGARLIRWQPLLCVDGSLHADAAWRTIGLTGAG